MPIAEMQARVFLAVLTRNAELSSNSEMEIDVQSKLTAMRKQFYEVPVILFRFLTLFLIMKMFSVHLFGLDGRTRSYNWLPSRILVDAIARPRSGHPTDF